MAPQPLAASGRGTPARQQHVLRCALVDVAPDDEAPTLVVGLEGRPLLVYRGFYAPASAAAPDNGTAVRRAVRLQRRAQDRESDPLFGALRFALVPHRFSAPLPAVCSRTEISRAG